MLSLIFGVGLSAQACSGTFRAAKAGSSSRPLAQLTSCSNSIRTTLIHEARPVRGGCPEGTRSGD